MPPDEIYVWNEFRLDVGRRLLLHGDQHVKLAGIPFDVLALLVRCQGRMLSKEEIFEAVWEGRPDTEFDPNLVDRVMSTIRLALGEKHPLRVERGRGVTFDAAVERLKISGGMEPTLPTRSYRTALAGALAAVTIVSGLGAVYWTRQPRPPSVLRLRPLTTSGTTKLSPMIVEERPHRVLFTEVINGRYQISWVEPESRNGGKIATALPNPTAVAISPDQKTLLIRSIVGGVQDDGPMFLQSLEAGAVRPLGITAYDGAWAPDGSWMVLTQSGALVRYDLNSGKTRELFKAGGYAWFPRFAPTGRTIRFSVLEGTSQINSLWELRLDDLRASKLSPETGEWSTAAAGNWTADGGEFFFHSGRGTEPYTLWWMPGAKSLYNLFVRPRRLTTGPISFRSPEADRTSRVLYVRGSLSRAEMIKVNLSTGSSTIALPEMSAAVASYSRDGRWVVYYSTNPEESLWKCTSSGADRQLLVPNPIQSSMPQWSPTGDRIVLSTRYPRQLWRLTLISATDGSREEFRAIDTNAISPTWSPDGQKIMFGTIPTVEKDTEKIRVYVLDLANRQLSVVPDSQGLYMPAWSPDGRYIAAVTALNGLRVFDFRKSHWLPQTGETADFLLWTKDSSGILFIDHQDEAGPSVKGDPAWPASSWERDRDFTRRNIMKFRFALSVSAMLLSAGIILSAQNGTQNKAVVQMDTKPAPLKAGGPITFNFTLNEPLPKGAHFDFRISPMSGDQEIALGSGQAVDELGKRFPSEGRPAHPTQKPVALFEYFIRTYTKPGDLVLDTGTRVQHWQRSPIPSMRP